jgi:16S rRNA processing protein RimM
VVTTDGRDLGVVTEVLENPAHEILVVGDVLIPFVDEFVGEIDDEANVILVKLIPGMLS